jgi:hypothetical protein
MAKPICPNCGAKITGDATERWSLWKINHGRRLCASCHSAIQIRRSVATIYLRAPFLLLAQMLVGGALTWGLLREGAIQIGEAKLIVAGCVMLPLLISIAVLMMLPGSIYEHCEVRGG